MYLLRPSFRKFTPAAILRLGWSRERLRQRRFLGRRASPPEALFAVPPGTNFKHPSDVSLFVTQLKESRIRRFVWRNGSRFAKQLVVFRTLSVNSVRKMKVIFHDLTTWVASKKCGNSHAPGKRPPGRTVADKNQLQIRPRESCSSHMMEWGEYPPLAVSPT